MTIPAPASPPPRPWARARALFGVHPSRLVALVAALAVILLGACEGSSLSDIDRRIDKLVLKKSDYLGGNAASPEVTTQSPDSFTYEGVSSKRPPSDNPAFNQLRYEQAPKISVEERLAKLDSYSQLSDTGRMMTLQDAWRVAQTSSRDYLNAEEDYLLAAIRLLVERHLWSPRFFNDTSANFSSLPTGIGGGNYQSAINLVNNLRATQRLPYGGAVEAQWIVRATQQLQSAATEEYTQSSSLILSGDIPLLRGAGLVAQESLIQAERNLIYAARNFESFRRGFLVDIAVDYFNLVLQQNAIENAATRLVSVRRLEEQMAALVEAGRRAAFDLNNVRQNVLRSQDDLTRARENYIFALDRFKIRLGIAVEENISLAPPELDLAGPDVTPDQAASIATTYRLDFQNRIDQLQDSRRSVANARNALLPGLDLSGSVSFNTDSAADVGDINFQTDETEFNLSALFSLPLDREIERLNLRSAIIGYQQSKRNLEQFRDGVILEARQAVREVDRAFFSLDLQEEAIRVNELRVEEQEIKADEVDPQFRLDAEDELLSSRNARDSAIRDIRVAILRYLETTGQLRVTPDGVFQPLPGMRTAQEANQPQQTDPGLAPPSVDPVPIPQDEPLPQTLESPD